MSKQNENETEAALISWILDGIDIVDQAMAEMDAADEADRLSAEMFA